MLDPTFIHQLESNIQRVKQLLEKQQYQKAIFLLQKNIDSIPSNFLHPLVAEMYAQWGFCSYYVGSYQLGIQHFETAIQIYYELPNSQESALSDCYNDMGACYGRIGDTTQELMCYEKALAIRLMQNTLNQESIAESYHNIGYAYGLLKQYDKQLEYLQKTLEITVRELGASHPKLAFTYHSIAWAHYYMGNHEESLTYHQNGLKLRQSILGKTHLQTTISHNQLAWFCCYFEQYDAAIQHHQSALNIRIQHFGALHEDSIISSHGIAKCLQRQGKYNEALKRIQSCLQYLVPNFQPNDLYENPSLQFYTFPLRLYECLRDKAWCFHLQFLQNRGQQGLEELRMAFQTYLLTTQLIDQIRNSYQGENSKLMLANETTWLFEHSIESAVLLYEYSHDLQYLEAAFTFFEKRKSLLLLSNLKDATAKIAATIPVSFLQLEQELRTQLTQLDHQIVEKQVELERQKKQGWMADTSLRQFQSQHFDLLQNYTALIRELEQNYPEYFQLKYQITTVSLEEAQRHLPENTSLLSYFIGEKKVYIFELDSHSNAQLPKVHHFDKPLDFEEVLAEFLESIEEMSRKQFIRKSLQLSNYLLGKVQVVQNAPIDQNHQLIILPHGQLSQIPFEALLNLPVSHKANYSALPYLVQQFDIGYHYSATLLCQTPRRKHEKKLQQKSDFVGFAPVYQHLEGQDLKQFGKQLSNLTLAYSEKELQSIQQLFQNHHLSSKIYLHKAATKTQLLANISHSKFIHIAAHGIVNQEEMALSGILLSPEKPTDSLREGMLYIGESYNLQLSADLVVLSSCQSGIGKLAKGEGVLAINRGFLYSGAKNVIFTLFKVYDEESAQLTQFLYEGILEGLSISKALSTAKRRLIAQEYTMPILWSGYVLIGGME